ERETRGLRDLRAERDLRRETEHTVGHASAVGMPAPVRDHLFEELVAQRGHAELLAVIGDDPVVREIERAHDTDTRRFLSGERRDRGDATLALQVPQPLRRAPREQHVLHQEPVEVAVAGARAARKSLGGHGASAWRKRSMMCSCSAANDSRLSGSSPSNEPTSVASERYDSTAP